MTQVEFTDLPDKMTLVAATGLLCHELRKSSGGFARAGGNLDGNDNGWPRRPALHDDVYAAEFVFDAMTKSFN